MQLRQKVSCVLDHRRVSAAKERLPQHVQALDAEEVLHNNMVLWCVCVFFFSGSRRKSDSIRDAAALMVLYDGALWMCCTAVYRYV